MALPTTASQLADRHAGSARSCNEQVDEVEIPGSRGLLRRAARAHAAAGRRCRSASCGTARGRRRHYLAIAFGFAEVLPDRVTILAQIAERAEEIDVARAEAAQAARRGAARAGRSRTSISSARASRS